MFEEEAEEYVNEEYDFCYYPEDNLSTRMNAEHDWQKGAEFGYNKANEWHYHEIPTDYTKPYLCKVIHPTKNDMTDYEILFYDEKEISWFRWLMPWDGGESNTLVRINRKVIAWKEIVPPKGKEK